MRKHQSRGHAPARSNAARDQYRPGVHRHPEARAAKAASLEGRRPGPSSFEAREKALAPQDDGSSAPQISKGVQTVKVLPDESGMRVDRFFEARYPGLSFSHIQRIIRKGEVRVNGKRTQPKNRLEAGQAVRIPPLKLEPPKPREDASEDQKNRAFIKSITLFEDDDVMVLNKPAGLAVQGGSGTVRHLDGLLGSIRSPDGQRPRLVHRLDKDTAGCLLVAKTRFAAAALAKRFARARRARSTGRWWRACRSRSRAAFRPISPRKRARTTPSCGSPRMATRAPATP